MKHPHTPDLHTIARRAVEEAGFEPDFPADVERALSELKDVSVAPGSDVRDMRGLLWSSIDNRESRDLDQVEYAETSAGGFRVLVGIADVDAYVPVGSAVDRRAAANTVSVYTPAEVFPMIPLELSTGLTSLLEGVDRLAVVMELNVNAGGDITSKQVYRAVVNNRAKMDYDTVGAWLEGHGPAPEHFARVEGLEEQIRVQDEIARSLYELRRRQGALELDRTELVPVVENGRIVRLDERQHNRAQDIIESLMLPANTSMAELLEEQIGRAHV